MVALWVTAETPLLLAVVAGATFFGELGAAAAAVALVVGRGPEDMGGAGVLFVTGGICGPAEVGLSVGLEVAVIAGVVTAAADFVDIRAVIVTVLLGIVGRGPDVLPLVGVADGPFVTLFVTGAFVVTEVVLWLSAFEQTLRNRKLSESSSHVILIVALILFLPTSYPSCSATIRYFVTGGG